MFSAVSEFRVMPRSFPYSDRLALALHHLSSQHADILTDMFKLSQHWPHYRGTPLPFHSHVRLIH